MIPSPALRSGARLAAGVLLLTASLAAFPPPAAAGSTTIRITTTLSPRTITVAPGTRITWTNADGDRHRVRSRTGPLEFDSGNVEAGASWSVVLHATGTYPYLDDRDRDDPAYHGTIVVSAATGATPSPSGGAGGSVGGASGGSTVGTTTPPPASAAVTIGDRVFRPGTVTIATGGSVTFRNADDRAHTATGRAASFDTGTLQPGATSRKRFPTAGTFAFLCAIHPEMQGTIRVVAPRSATAPPPAAAQATPRPTPTARTAPAGAGTPSARSAALSIVDFAFAPGSTTVATGTTVTWTNAGQAPHTVTAADGSFDSGLLDRGATWSRTFLTAGTVRIVCAVHPAMAATIVVTDTAPAPAETTTGSAPERPASIAPSAPPDIALGPTTAGGPSAPPVAVVDATASATTRPSPIDVASALRATLALLATGAAILVFGRLIGGLARR